MRAITKTLFSTCAVCIVAHGHAARAQADPPTTQPSTSSESQTKTEGTYSTSYETDTAPDMYSWSDDRLQSGVGISVLVGGGITGFTDEAMRDATSSLGGLWDVRLTLGSHIPLGLDLSYVGSAMNIDRLPEGQEGTLIGTTLEAALRFNILPHATWNPYIFAGAGWQRFDVTETDVTLATVGMNDKDNLLEFPMGAGVSYRRNGFVADLRGTFRAAVNQDLVLTTPSPTSDDFAPMHTWAASAAIGYEF